MLEVSSPSLRALDPELFAIDGEDSDPAGKENRLSPSEGELKIVLDEPNNEDGDEDVFGPRKPKKSASSAVDKKQKKPLSKTDIQQMHSETQRFVRESRITLPGHYTKPTNLKEFLQRRVKALQEKGEQDSIRSKLFQKVTESKSSQSVSKTDSPQRKAVPKLTEPSPSEEVHLPEPKDDVMVLSSSEESREPAKVPLDSNADLPEEVVDLTKAPAPRLDRADFFEVELDVPETAGPSPPVGLLLNRAMKGIGPAKEPANAQWRDVRTKLETEMRQRREDGLKRRIALYKLDNEEMEEEGYGTAEKEEEEEDFDAGAESDISEEDQEADDEQEEEEPLETELEEEERRRDNPVSAFIDDEASEESDEEPPQNLQIDTESTLPPNELKTMEFKSMENSRENSLPEVESTSFSQFLDADGYVAASLRKAPSPPGSELAIEDPELAMLCSGPFQLINTDEDAQLPPSNDSTLPRDFTEAMKGRDGEDDEEPWSYPCKRRMTVVSEDEDNDDEQAEEQQEEEAEAAEPEKDEFAIRPFPSDDEQELVEKGPSDATGFFEQEAELSGEEWSSDEEEGGDDGFQQWSGDEDELPNEDELRNQLHRIHMKRNLDDDQRELRVLQEMLLEDGDLHGQGRKTKNFRWRNLEDAAPLVISDASDDEEDGAPKDHQWRINRLERETWVEESGGDEHVSQLMQLGMRWTDSQSSSEITNDTSKSSSLLGKNRALLQRMAGAGGCGVVERSRNNMVFVMKTPPAKKPRIAEA